MMTTHNDLQIVESEPFTNMINDYLLNGNGILPNNEVENLCDTKFVVPFTETCPTAPTGPPSRKNFPGPYNFYLEINGANTQDKYVYSHKLHRIYVDMKKNFSVNFNWDTTKFDQPMYVRATVVFSDPSQAEKRVERCSQHFYEQSGSQGAEKMTDVEKKNVLRSARASGSPGVFYCGSPSDVNSWYSVVVLLSAPSSLAYTFVCKSSCSSGINRRAITIIFTLEDIAGIMYGQDSVSVRVCSCPRRDMRRDEKDETPAGKRKLAPPAAAAPPAKAPRTEPARRHDQLVPLKPITVVGSSTAITGYIVMRNMMKQMKDQRISSQQPVEDLDKAIDSIQQEIDRLENTGSNT